MSKPRLQEANIQSLEVVRELLPWRKELATAFGTSHGNASLQTLDVLIVMLAAFYNPLVRSQRLIEALSEQAWLQNKFSINRIPRSTFSDALKRFDPKTLRPLIDALARRVPALASRDPDLAGITRQILAADGSYFNLAGDVVWALHNRLGRSDRHLSSVRLNLQLDVEQFLPVEADVSGRADGAEAKAFQRNLKPGVLYLLDRNFTHWGFLQAVLDKGSNFVVRLRKDVYFDAAESRPPGEKDAAAGVRSDDLGHLPGPKSESNQGRRGRQGRAPSGVLRRVVVWDPRNNQDVILLTDLLDLPAHVIGLLYRKRWQIELFLRWLKCWAGMEHLVSQSPAGVTFQFYVAVIATLLTHIATGRRVSKYALFWLGSVAAGHATVQQMFTGLARIEREKELEKARLAARKAALKNPI